MIESARLSPVTKEDKTRRQNQGESNSDQELLLKHLESNPRRVVNLFIPFRTHRSGIRNFPGAGLVDSPGPRKVARLEFHRLDEMEENFIHRHLPTLL